MYVPSYAGEILDLEKATACMLPCVTLLSPAVIRRQQGWTAPNPG